MKTDITTENTENTEEEGTTNQTNLTNRTIGEAMPGSGKQAAGVAVAMARAAADENRTERATDEHR